MSCKECIHARMAFDDIKGKYLVACISTPNGMEEKENMIYLDSVNYTGESYSIGFSYNQSYPGTKSNGKMSSGYILTESNAKCNNFIKREYKEQGDDLEESSY